MFSRKTAVLNIILRNIKINPVRNSANLTKETKEKWEIFCGVCLERKPVISRSLSNIEISFSNMLNDIELENSMKSDHELRHENDVRKAEELAKGKLSSDEVEKTIGQTALEFEDACRKELATFTPAPRVTEADEENDVKSTERKLDQHLLYIVNVKLGKVPVWLLPQDVVKGDENLRTAAERIIREKCGDGVKARFLSNAPCGFYKYRYPKGLPEKKDISGAKIFFMKAQYLSGDVDDKISDFNWATREELHDRFVEKYYATVRNFLMDDDLVDSS